MNNLLSIQHITKKYQKSIALNNVSFDIPKGSVFGLMGPNGAGKTTLLRIINQIIYQDSGKILLEGKSIMSNDIQFVGYMPEERGLYNNMKVGEQIVYLAQLKNMDKKLAKKCALEWMEILGMKDWWNKKIAELSKGMAQKVQFIVTVIHQPKLLIFDEPFSGFDPINANVIADEILKLRDQGATVIFSTHRMESVEEMCDHVALIDQSKLILEGKLIDIKKQYKTNTFEVGLVADHSLEFKTLLDGRFKVEPAHFISLKDDFKYKITLLENSHTPNEFLEFLSSQAQVTHFVEQIPSVRDIFINAVN